MSTPQPLPLRPLPLPHFLRPLGLFGVLCACNPMGGGTSMTAGEATTATTGEVTTTTGGDACGRAADCETEGICVADYLPDEGGRGDARCVDLGECIGPLELDLWCFEHASCCEGLRCRGVDGICEEPGLGQTTGDVNTTSESDTGDTSTGTDGDTDTGDTNTDGDTDTSTGG